VVIIAAALYSLCLMGAFPFLVNQMYTEKKVEIKEALSHGWKNKGKICITSLLIFLISLPLIVAWVVTGSMVVSHILIGMFIPGRSVSLPNITLLLIVLILSLVFYVYIFLRLGMVFPVLILEKLSPIESLKRSWNLMKGKILSFFIGGIILGIVAGVPVETINLFIAEKGIIANIFGYLLRVIPATFSSIFPTVYYLLMQKQDQPK
jgi:membrane-anchored glycerophosphoryl diester phosphodiesterase (GDPDase)